MEDNLSAPIRVFLPPCNLVIDSQRNTFLEFAVVIIGIACDEARALKAQSNVKVFRDMGLRPIRNVVFGFCDADRLDSRPSKECIVANKGRVLTISDIEVDLRLRQ
jgi:hypothetical protein